MFTMGLVDNTYLHSCLIFEKTQSYSSILYGVTCGGRERRTTTFICRLAHFIPTPTYLVIVIVIKHIGKSY